MPISPITDKTDLTTFTILANGTQIPDTYQVVSIRTEQHLNRISEAEIILLDGSASKETFEISNSSTFIPGSIIEIKLGYHSKEEAVFKGIVVKQNIKVNENNAPTLHVLCWDETLSLTIERKNAVFRNKTDSDVINQILNNHRLTAEIAKTVNIQEHLVQHNTSDWDFILNRAKINGMVVSTESGTVKVAPPQVSTKPQLEVTYGHDIFALDCEMDAEYQFDSVESSAWSPAKQSDIVAASTEPTQNKQGNISGKQLSEVLGGDTHKLMTSANIPEENLKTWANATLLNSRLSRFRGTVTFQGSSLAKMNTTIKLNGISSRFNGDAFVSGVSHLVEAGDWKTRVSIGLSHEKTIENEIEAPLLASGLIPGIQGLHSAVVKQIDDDPKSEFRVLVEIPIIDENNERIWARLASPYAGNGMAAFFLPEIGDEVIVGFTNNDPRSPIILGSMHSSAKPAPETPDRDNSVKTIVTRNKLQLKFDDEQKLISLNTPGGNSMVISDTDGGLTLSDTHGNKIEMNSSGITIDSKSDLNLKAANSVSINGASISVNGTESISNTAGTVTITGNLTTSISGNAECRVSSSGQMSITGAMTMIN
ncbi:type VI secretion system tip protein VgrG [Aureitalea sp. L0-47]|uniref:type VI secretion system tip protein VgrG n=1 Tax=Aureitalea sp. L0-47 TaxID=2816962 RepID=UPI0022378909|nr:type VI secretion system tip protein VgrG [Aureitalea sp. L0-47]MCW5519049.1 type VI secretion system tip protein VgrG [Aureitalea sp. L0-47]